MKRLLPIMIAGIALLAAVPAFATPLGTTVTLPDSSQTTTLTATVSEQVTVSVPASITFDVTNINSATNSAFVPVTLSQIVTSSELGQVKISLIANQAQFSTPGLEVATWNASDVSWNESLWMGAFGTAGTLSNEAYNTVATTWPGLNWAASDILVFTLGANPSITRSGDYSLGMTWKFESIAPI